MAASTHLTPAERRERSRNASRARWEKDPAGIDRYVDQIVKRAPALTAEQKDRLAVLLRGDAA